MKPILKTLLILFALSLPTQRLDAQIYAKLNGLYALVGVINPAVEFTVSPKSTFQTEIVFSPWKYVNDHGVDKPMKFGILMTEYRRYFKQHNWGWYLGANMGMMGFKMSKPQFSDGWFLENRYSKGYGMMIGICGGFEYQFADRWLLDAYFGWSYMLSWYNGYSLDGTIDLYPHRPVQLEKPDPFNGSHEWLPNKIGVSIGFMIFNPARRGRTGSSCAVR
ncbi:DUF3575 domain-containing protein [Alistipes sp. dk3620]|jgi:hypothetical protein|uniref:DUF3575 domain-containing protein n=1 Tax=unclassified Alistipes TaxID=2608932 RepID=UPI000E83923D|nr:MULTISPECIES: DUF3575 domain-containing protein [unclassified Alistipes]MQX28437.1 DUF3575 domain-containing protein [Alistipes sp. dk3620]QGA22642.1 DUF3575 domain-containing protein [Alistipes sp. dk3624]HAY32027.1 hypothetical protein [Alistipes sp.]HIV60682.1 DUF3575 domain-containing protein [Candidatus Alistipes pullistercoris]